MLKLDRSKVISIRTFSTKEQLDTGINQLLHRNILPEAMDLLLEKENVLADKTVTMLKPLLADGTLHISSWHETLEGPFDFTGVLDRQHGELIGLRYYIRWNLFNDTDTVLETPASSCFYLARKATAQFNQEHSRFEIVDVVEQF